MEIDKIREKKIKEIMKTKNNPQFKAVEFANAILESKEYKDLQFSDEIIEDIEAKKLLSLYEKKQDLLQVRSSPELIEELGEIKKELQRNKRIQVLIKAQQEFVELIRLTNVVITGIIGTQFAWY